jgi:hypothetical protein
MSNPSGTWNVTVSTPFGPQQLTIDLKVVGEKVSGTATHPSGSMTFDGGTYTDDKVKFRVSLTAPITTELKVSAKADGDTLTGNAKAGMLSFSLAGTRA